MISVAIIFLITSSRSSAATDYDETLNSAATEPYQESWGGFTGVPADEELVGTTVESYSTIESEKYVDRRELDGPTVASQTSGYVGTGKDGGDDGETTDAYDRGRQDRESSMQRFRDSAEDLNDMNYYRDLENTIYMVKVENKDGQMNYTGVLINKDIVVTPHIPRAEKVVLCQEGTCKPTKRAKQTKHFTYWRATSEKARKSIKFYDEDISEATVCTAGPKNVYFSRAEPPGNGTIFECAPSCNKGELIVCDDLPFGFVKSKKDEKTIVVATIEDLLVEGDYPKMVRAMPGYIPDTSSKDKKKRIRDDYYYDDYDSANVMSISMFSTLIFALIFVISS